VSYETAITTVVPPRCDTDCEAQGRNCANEDRTARALSRLSKSCLYEITVTLLRVEHLYRNPPCGDVDPKKWRWSMAVCEPLTTIEEAIFDTNDERLVRLAYPAPVSLIEKEIDARYESDHAGCFVPRQLVTDTLI